MNPVKGVSRPKVDTYEGKTPTISDAQVRHLLEAPKGQTLKAKRNHAILSILSYHALRRDELCNLMVKDIHDPFVGNEWELPPREAREGKHQDDAHNAGA